VTEPKTAAALVGEHLAKAYGRLGDIADMHRPDAVNTRYCRECGWEHPCATYLTAKGVTRD